MILLILDFFVGLGCFDEEESADVAVLGGAFARAPSSSVAVLPPDASTECGGFSLTSALAIWPNWGGRTGTMLTSCLLEVAPFSEGGAP